MNKAELTFGRREKELQKLFFKDIESLGISMSDFLKFCWLFTRNDFVEDKIEPINPKKVKWSLIKIKFCGFSSSEEEFLFSLKNKIESILTNPVQEYLENTKTQKEVQG